MDNQIRLRVETAVRVRDFLRANPFGQEPADQLAARFGELVSTANALFIEQEQGLVASKRSSQDRKGLRRQMLQEPLRHLRKIAKAIAPQVPGLAVTLHEPLRGVSEKAFQARVLAIAQEAQAHRAEFLAAGLSEESLDELDRMVAAYDKAVTDANAGRRAHTGARRELRKVTLQLMRSMDTLDGIVRYRFRGQAKLLGEWDSARNVAWPEGQPSTASEKKSGTAA